MLDFGRIPAQFIKTLAEETGNEFGALQFCKSRGKEELKLLACSGDTKDIDWLMKLFANGKHRLRVV